MRTAYSVLCAIALCILCIATLAVPPVLAQDAEVATQQVAPDYGAWEVAATEARSVLDGGTASNEELTSLRAQLSVWRERFLTAQDTNAVRIQTLREQITALGPAPAEGESEPQDIADRRATLNEQLQQALAPVRAAEEAYTNANGLIAELDALVRERQAARTFRLDPTPLNPVYWPDTVVALGLVAEAVTGEVVNNYTARTNRNALRSSLPLAGLLLVVGLILVTRSGSWIERVLLRLRQARSDSRASFRVATFLGSLFGMILPVAGIFAIITGVNFTQMTAVVGDTVLRLLSILVICLAAGRWLSTQVFPKVNPPRPVLPLSPIGLAEGRFYAFILALLIALDQGVQLLADNQFLSSIMTVTVQGVLKFPIIAIAGVMLVRLGLLMLRAARAPVEEEEAEEGAGTRSNLIASSLARGALIVGVAGPVMAAIGYVTAGSALVISSVLTLALFALLAVLQRFVRDVYAMIMRDEDSDNALIPVLVSFVLAILAIPVLALIWGARLSDLSEGWAVLSAGIQLGDSRISPSDFVTFAVIFGIGYMLTRLLQSGLKTQVLPKTRMDIGGRNAVVSGVGYIGIFLAALMAITGAGIDLSSLAIVAGALSVGIGFGLQTIVSNFVSGIILLIERPISEGDWIEVGGTMGVVRAISVRATRIETFDRRDVIVPNADLISTSVTNWTKGNLTGRIIVSVGAAYGSDTRKVEAILREVAEDHPQVIVNPPPNVFFIGFGADSLDFEIRAILRDVNYVMAAPSDMRHEIARRFAEEGIEIPFAQRDLWLRNPEALHAPDPSATQAPASPAKTKARADDPDAGEGDD
jgi:small-conductance mechanosensitive channel